MIGRKILLALSLLVPTAGAAKVKELSLEIRKTEFKRHAYYPDKRDWRGYVGLNWKMDWKHGYWNNRAYFYGDESQVRHIGWEYEFGLKLLPQVDLFYYHHSEHSADAESPTGDRFPLEDSIGFRFKLHDM